MASAFTTCTNAARPPTAESARSAAAEPARTRALDRERRVVHRAPCRLQWWNLDSNQPAACVGQTTNLSSRGLAVQISHRLLTGTRVEAYLPSLSGAPTRVIGTVVRCQLILADTFEIGIRFLR